MVYQMSWIDANICSDVRGPISRGFAFIMCHKFSMGLASGEFPGQSRTGTFLLAKKAIVEADLCQVHAEKWIPSLGIQGIVQLQGYALIYLQIWINIFTNMH